MASDKSRRDARSFNEGMIIGWWVGLSFEECILQFSHITTYMQLIILNYKFYSFWIICQSGIAPMKQFPSLHVRRITFETMGKYYISGWEITIRLHLIIMVI